MNENEQRIADDSGRTKHEAEIAFFNDLLIDLKLREMGKEPRQEIAMDRLMEASHHIGKLAQCRERMRWK